MSAVMTLYKPEDVKITGHTFFDLEKDERTKILEDYDENNPMDFTWSDGQRHDYIDLLYYSWMARRSHQNFGKVERNWKKYFRRLSSNFNFQRYNGNHIGYPFLILPVEEVYYWQGRGLSHRFFKKRFTTYFATEKEQMVKFLNKHARPKNKYDIEAFRTFVDKWEDGMIFECSW